MLPLFGDGMVMGETEVLISQEADKIRKESTWDDGLCGPGSLSGTVHSFP